MSRRHALACDECRSLLGGYVLDALEPDEMDAVRWFSLATAEARATRLNEQRLLRRARRLLEGDGRKTDRTAPRGRTP